MIFASVPVIQPPDQMTDTWPRWQGCGAGLLIVDNTTDRAWQDFATEHGYSWVGLGKNMGVCGAWNIARAAFLAENGFGHGLLLLFSATMHFDDGLPAVMDQLRDAANWKGCQTQYAGHAFAYSRKLLERAGSFDENFYPGYYGDNDYWYRGICDGWLRAGPDAIPQIEINAPKPEDGRALRMTGIPSNMRECHDYYCARWGGPPGEETFTSPFDLGLPTWWWSPQYKPGLEHITIGER